MTDDELLEADLDAFIDSEAGLPPEDAVDVEPPRNVEQADLLLRRRAGVVREISKIELLVDNRVSSMRAWGVDRTAGLRARLTQLDAAVEAWTRATLTGRKVKTERLRHGAVSLRSHADLVRVTDEDAFAKWADAEGHGDTMLRKVVTPMVTEIKRLTAKGAQLEDLDVGDVTFERWAAIDPASGEIIPHVEYRRERVDTFNLKQ